ncbi:MAG: 16S rRNA (adenine(1518)-N(6)/adenine(1519)-N(6))-dimethyltransferase RsmA [Phycisphaeraceae bacterium]|nr:16S rRNA (adenine(1518)-N(6)/adenine(1519)-N(6))-dimethyltransferase RsmA [Phycisphaeraceae bacterium]
MSQTVTEIRAMLAAHGLRPKKWLGQNFLIDANHLQRILDAAAIGRGDLVLEVGPGTGTLTVGLLEAGATVVAVEADEALEPLLAHHVGETYPDRFHLVIGDVLAGKHAINPAVGEALADAAGETDPPFTLVANLPYQVASPMLINFAVGWPNMTSAVVMVQREVADRMVSESGGRTYGPLTIMVQAMCEVEVVSTLPPQAFWPAPQVSSAVVRLTRRADPLTDDPAALSALVHQLFTRRRKTLGRILGRDHPLPEGVSHDDRPETLSVEQVAQLATLTAGNGD